MEENFEYKQLTPEQSKKIFKNLFAEIDKRTPLEEYVIQQDSYRKSIHLLIESLGYTNKTLQDNEERIGFVLYDKEIIKKIESKLIELIDRL